MELLDRRVPLVGGRVGAPPIRIIHLGLGAFHRAHQAWYTHEANKSGAETWGIAAFTGRSPRAAELLQPQHGLYTLVTRSAEGDTAEVMESISEAVDGSDERRWLELFSSADTAVVTLTVTEAGYRHDRLTGLDLLDGSVAADIALLRARHGHAPTTAPGRLVGGLRARHEAGVGGLAIVSCDNLPDNGLVTRSVVLGMARAVDPALAGWIEASVSFVSTMVDRITPATTADDLAVAAGLVGFLDRSPVVTEPFAEWIICGDFPAGRPGWERAGARFVPDIEPWERRKLWLLNAGHSLLAYVGLLRGHTTIAEAMGDEVCLALLEQMWRDAAAVLPFPPEEIDVVTSALRRRFINPRIRHQLAQIAADGSLKLPLRVMPVVDRRLDAGLDAGAGETAAIAAWVLHLTKRAPHTNDPGAHELIRALGRGLERDVESVVRFLGPTGANLTTLVDAVTERTLWLAAATAATAATPMKGSL